MKGTSLQGAKSPNRENARGGGGERSPPTQEAPFSSGWGGLKAPETKDPRGTRRGTREAAGRAGPAATPPTSLQASPNLPGQEATPFGGNFREAPSSHRGRDPGGAAGDEGPQSGPRHSQEGLTLSQRPSESPSGPTCTGPGAVSQSGC